MRLSEIPAARREVLVVPGVDRAVGHVRRRIRDLVGADHPCLDDASLCASELLTNALRHTDSGRGGQMRVELAIGEKSVRVEVTDDGCSATVPHIRNDSGADDRGGDDRGGDDRGGDDRGGDDRGGDDRGADDFGADDRGESGRGLRIVDAYADEWGVERRGVGHAVWFSISR